MKEPAAKFAWKPIYTAESTDRSTAPTSEVERFLAANTIYCTAYRARLKREQCGVNRDRGLHLCVDCPQGKTAPKPPKPKRRPFIKAVTPKQVAPKTATDRRKGVPAEGRPRSGENQNVTPEEMRKLQLLLKAHQATQSRLSALMKIPNPTLSHYMTGVRRPTEKFQSRLPGAVAELLNLQLEDVLQYLGRCN